MMNMITGAWELISDRPKPNEIKEAEQLEAEIRRTEVALKKLKERQRKAAAIAARRMYDYFGFDTGEKLFNSYFWICESFISAKKAEDCREQEQESI
jgi:hypothetical protein